MLLNAIGLKMEVRIFIIRFDRDDKNAIWYTWRWIIIDKTKFNKVFML